MHLAAQLEAEAVGHAEVSGGRPEVGEIRPQPRAPCVTDLPGRRGMLHGGCDERLVGTGVRARTRRVDLVRLEGETVIVTLALSHQSSGV
jgi:hypothetical protein